MGEAAQKVLKWFREKKRKRLELGRCCWHCRHYLRAPERLMLDGPLGNVCIVDRPKEIYPLQGELNPGEKMMKPDGYCGRFEMEPPPKAAQGFE